MGTFVLFEVHVPISPQVSIAWMSFWRMLALDGNFKLLRCLVSLVKRRVLEALEERGR